MMKKDHNFRLPKAIKRVMASMPKEKSTQFKSLMINAIILGSIEPPREKRKNKHKNSVVEVETVEE